MAAFTITPERLEQLAKSPHELTLEAEDDNRLYVVDRFPRFDEPVIDVCWFPLDIKASAFKRNYGDESIGRGLYRGFHSGQYVFKKNVLLRFTLPQGGSTKSVRVEAYRVPRPKSRVETRWKNGRWQKLLKRKGWVNV